MKRGSLVELYAEDRSLAREITSKRTDVTILHLSNSHFADHFKVTNNSATRAVRSAFDSKLDTYKKARNELLKDRERQRNRDRSPNSVSLQQEAERIFCDQQGRLNVTPISLSTTGVFHPSSLNFLLAFSRAYGNKTKMHTSDGHSVFMKPLKFFFAKAAI
ncbi:hypothetical protein ADUPG1_001762, partial [Aduncisulcus paluster]